MGQHTSSSQAVAVLGGNRSQFKKFSAPLRTSEIAVRVIAGMAVAAVVAVAVTPHAAERHAATTYVQLQRVEIVGKREHDGTAVASVAVSKRAVLDRANIVPTAGVKLVQQRD